MLLTPTGGPRFCQSEFVKFVLSTTWYGAIPPVQLSSRLFPCRTAPMTMGVAGKITTCIVAVSNNPPASAARTVNPFVPASTESGVPVRPPLLATLSHAGPPTLLNVIGSPLGSLALVARVAEYNWPALAMGAVKGLLGKMGARFVAVRK